MPTHLERIRSAINQIPPDLDFDVSQSDFQFSQPFGAESFNRNDSQSSQGSFIGSADETPTTSFTQRTEQAFKKPRKKQ